VSEARVFRALVCIETKTELLDATQALKFCGINQAHHQLTFVRVGLQPDDVVNGIAVNAFCHCGPKYITAASGNQRERLKFLDFPIFLDSTLMNPWD
jgi:hypothetical protein